MENFAKKSIQIVFNISRLKCFDYTSQVCWHNMFRNKEKLRDIMDYFPYNETVHSDKESYSILDEFLPNPSDLLPFCYGKI